MKPMSQRSMGMSAGQPKSAAFFPENAHTRTLGKAGEVRKQKYPDTEQEILSEQNQGVSAANRGANKPGYRH
jgi:hypothetical protein